MNWLDLPVTVVDTETNGLDVTTARIWEIGIVHAWQNQVRVTNALINPDAPIPAEIIKLSHLSTEQLLAIQRAPKFAAAAIPLSTRLLHGFAWPNKPDSTLLVGYNLLDYDLPLLKCELERCQCADWLVQLPPVIDVLVLAREMLKHIKSRKLIEVAKYLNVQIPFGGKLTNAADIENCAHRASIDCLMTLEVLKQLASGLPSSLDELLVQQMSWRAVQKANSDKYSYWLREEAGVLILNCGKHNNVPLKRCPRNYLQFLVGASDSCAKRIAAGRPKQSEKEWDTPLPENVYRLFREALG